jgi:hypothetical protein
MSDRAAATEEVQGEIAANKHECPSCHVVLDRKEGCDYVECPRCHTRFCFRCSAPMPADTDRCPPHECDREGDIRRVIDERTHLKERTSADLSDQSMQLIVRPTYGQPIAVTTQKTSTGADLKKAVYSKSGSPPKQQLLSYAGRPITDGLRISDTTMRSKSCVILAISVVGGLLQP